MRRASNRASSRKNTASGLSRDKKLLDDAAKPVEHPAPEASRRSPRETRILRAVIEELARSDYGGLTFERVAARAGVNRATVYRHWETKADLVRAALSLVMRAGEPEETSGALRADLIRVGRRMVDFLTSFEGQFVIRLLLLQQPEPELATLAKELQRGSSAQAAALGEAAVARGELSRSADFGVILDMLSGAVHGRLFMKNEPVDAVVLAGMVDILMRGVGAGEHTRGAKRQSEAPRHGRRH
jgi:AcrR family transcriptional regulator